MAKILSPQFKVLKEPWNEYKLEDDTLLKHKLVLGKVIIPGINESGEPVIGTGTRKLTTVYPPERLKGKPDNDSHPPEEVANSIEKEEVEIKEKIKEDWAEYKLENNINVKIKPAIAQISRSSLFDNAGDPIYRVNSQVLIKTSIPQDTKQKIRRKF